jgi:hypothetical protein
LYIYTDGARFNVSLITASQEVADYIVYLKFAAPPVDPKQEHWRSWLAVKSQGPMRVEIHRVGQAGDMLLVEMSVLAAKAIEFQPSWIWVTQGGHLVPVESLSLTQTRLKPGDLMQGLLSIEKKDTRLGLPLRLEIRKEGDSTIQLPLPEVKRWMK